MKFTTKTLVTNGVIAALYCALTMLLGDVGYGPVQFRPAEAMTMLPFLFPQVWPGLFIGCLVSNLLSPYGLLDIVLGSLATLSAALLTSRCKKLWLAALPPIIINAVVIGFCISIGTLELGMGAWPMMALSVGGSEAISVLALGVPLVLVMRKLGLKEKLGLQV